MNPIQDVRARLLSGEAVVAGVLSGTSADGIDVALARFPPPGRADRAELAPPELLAFRTTPFAPQLASEVRAVLAGESLPLAKLALLNRDLGTAFGEAALALAVERGLVLDLVASHGQTVFHHDGTLAAGAATLQLGDGDFAAEACGACVVSDFRPRDIAAGGEGAPLSALADPLLFHGLARPASVLNLGGMANLTLLADSAEDAAPVAFDTGPAGSLLDGLAGHLLGCALDVGGAAASRGRADERLVAELLRHPFFDRAPPKSTGRDTFGTSYVTAVVERARSLGVLRERGPSGERGAAHVLASAVELIARTVAEALDRFAPPGRSALVLAGGGAKNRALVAALERAVPEAVYSSEACGVDPDAREALVFAVLGARALLGIPSSAPEATGARAGRILGKISPAPPRSSSASGPAHPKTARDKGNPS